MHRHPLPESCSRLTTLHAGAWFGLHDWRCAGHDTVGREDEWCDADRVVVTRRGVYELTLDGRSGLVDTARVTFWRRGAYYRVRHPLAGGDECTVFRLAPEVRDAWAEAMRAPRLNGRLLTPRADLAHRTALARARRQAAGDPLAVEEPVVELLREVLAPEPQAPEPRLTRAARESVQRAQAAIERDFRERLSLFALARKAGCSPFHLGRQFRRLTGASLHHALVARRLRAALDRLLDEPERIVDVALDVGFASHSHFTDAFRAEYGCAPSEARNRIAQAARPRARASSPRRRVAKHERPRTTPG